MRNASYKLTLAACFAAYLVLTFRNLTKLAETEFSGGWLTGRLLTLQNLGSLLFLLAVLATIFSLRIAAVAGIAASVLCLPLHLFFVAPGLYQRIFQGNTRSRQLRLSFGRRVVLGES